MLGGAAFDLMVNLTDMQEHEHLNRQAIETGKHVWSEKPMANSLDAGQQLLEAARKKGVRLWGAPAMVVSPQFAFRCSVDHGISERRQDGSPEGSLISLDPSVGATEVTKSLVQERRRRPASHFGPGARTSEDFPAYPLAGPAGADTHRLPIPSVTSSHTS
jgi:hypothetical protein